MKRGNSVKAVSGIVFLSAIIITAGFGITYNKDNSLLADGDSKTSSVYTARNNDTGNEKENSLQVAKQQEEKEPAEEKIETISISAVGDFLIHMGIINSQYNYVDGKYDFMENFQYIKDYLEEADLTIGNLETTFAGSEVPYAGYPTFNCPDELALAMQNVGVDVVCNMSNHSLDEGEAGFYRTRQVLKNTGFDVIGTRDTANDKRYIIKDVKGIKVGIIGYGYMTEDYDGTLGLNCIPISSEVMPLMNVFNPNKLDSYLEEMKEQVNLMRQDGADAIVFYMHWGEEYQLEPNESQLRIAQFLADQGVDIIFGDHPHTIQPFDILTSADGKSTTNVIYSLGNFISCQRTESVDNPYTEDGVIANVEITKNFATGETKAAPPTYIPTWVKADSSDVGTKYTVVPSNKENVDYLQDWQRERLIQSFARTSSIVESYNQSINVDNN